MIRAHCRRHLCATRFSGTRGVSGAPLSSSAPAYLTAQHVPKCASDLRERKKVLLFVVVAEWPVSLFVCAQVFRISLGDIGWIEHLLIFFSFSTRVTILGGAILKDTLSRKIKTLCLSCWAFGSDWFSLVLAWLESGCARVFPSLSSSLAPFNY